MKLGIYKYGKKLYYRTCLWTEREYEDDRWYDEYFLDGWQIFPVIKRVRRIGLSGSRDELTKFCNDYWKTKSKRYFISNQSFDYYL